MKENIYGFTIVEIVVVVVIVTILGTIGFLSFQGYAAESRDTSRNANLQSIRTIVNDKKVGGVALINMIVPLFANRLASISVGGIPGIAGTNYEAGTPNRTVLGVKSNAFNDPSGLEFRMGAISKYGGKYQLASIAESEGMITANVIGNYLPRILPITVSAPNTSPVIIITLAQDYNKFRVGDYVGCNDGVPSGTIITAVSADGRQLTLSNTTTTAGCTGLFLGDLVTPVPESLGLIDDFDGAGAVVDGGSTALPY